LPLALSPHVPHALSAALGRAALLCTPVALPCDRTARRRQRRPRRISATPIRLQLQIVQRNRGLLPTASAPPATLLRHGLPSWLTHIAGGSSSSTV
jgi:hypothetical protein